MRLAIVQCSVPGIFLTKFYKLHTGVNYSLCVIRQRRHLSFPTGRIRLPSGHTCLMLAVPAASTSSERLFSLAVLTLSDRRSNLSEDSVDGLLFIHGLK